jgi:hypothetical protein
MKTLMQLLTMFMFVFITSGCKKDIDQPIGPIDATLLPGTWQLIGFHAAGTNSYRSGINLVSASYESVGFDFATMTTFTENPNTHLTEGRFSYVQTVNQTNGMIDRDTIVLPSNITTGTWTINGNTLTEETATNTYEYTIEELNETRLRLRLDFHQVTVLEEVPITSIGQVIRTFERL